MPPMTVVEPLTPDSSAVHVLEMLVAWSASFGSVPTSVALAVLVTYPVGPVVPSVPTVTDAAERTMGPGAPPGKRIRTVHGAVSVIGVAEPPGGSVTEAVGCTGGCGCPKKLMLLEQLNALPCASVTTSWVAPAGVSPRPARISAAAETRSVKTLARRLVVGCDCTMLVLQTCRSRVDGRRPRGAAHFAAAGPYPWAWHMVTISGQHLV